MPVENVPVEDSREPGRIVQGWAWADEIHIYAGGEMITIVGRVWNSAAAAYNPASESFTRAFLRGGEDYRDLVRANPQLWGAIAGLADGVLQAEMGGDVVPATLPAWAAEPPEEG
jgi:hypothetical protein